MPTRTVFSDVDNNEMDCYLNSQGKVYMCISLPGEDNMYSGSIALGKDDVHQLIKILSELEKEMPE